MKSYFHGRLKLVDLAEKHSILTEEVCVLAIFRVSLLPSVKEAGVASALKKLYGYCTFEIKGRQLGYICERQNDCKGKTSLRYFNIIPSYRNFKEHN